MQRGDALRGHHHGPHGRRLRRDRIQVCVFKSGKIHMYVVQGASAGHQLGYEASLVRVAIFNQLPLDILGHIFSSTKHI